MPEFAYELVAPIGRGESSEVFRARDRSGRAVAVKLIGGLEAQRPGLLDRLAAEVALSRRLGLPGLVALRECGLRDGQPFLAMELVEGESLKAAMAQGPLSPSRSIAVVRAVAETLVVVHQAGAVHRDVKPSNIMLRADSTPVLMDLGVAALAPADRGPGADLVGSPAYLAPEIIADRPFDGKADVFALGVVLYRLLTGQRPFAGTPDEAMDAILHHDPLPPSAVASGVPSAFDRIVARALAKGPADRFTAAELAEALRRGLL